MASETNQVILGIMQKDSVFQLNVTGDVQPGAVYIIETARRLGTNLSWSVLEPVQARDGQLAYELPPAVEDAAFFRVRLPQPTLLRIEPAVAPSGGGTDLYLIGQRLRTGGQVRIAGQTLTPEPIQPGVLYRMTLPALPEGLHDVEWVEAGQVVTRVSRVLSISAQPLPAAQRLYEPPEEPPASPEGARHGKLGVNLVGVNLVDHLTPGGGAGRGRQTGAVVFADYDFKELSKVPGRGSQVFVQVATGELQLQECDVIVPGVGLDFAFVRTYRSRTGRTTPMGHGWDHSYNLSIEAVGDDIAVCDGTGRRDVLFRQDDGTYAREEFFWHGRWDPTNGNFILEFPGKGIWEFYHFSVRPGAGRIARIADANGNELHFTYNLSDQLTEVTDTLGRVFTFEYTPDGFLRSLRDFTGRRWIYTYHDDRSTGGGPGDLASVTTPPVTDTPTGNDFPTGKTTSYTYTRGTPDDRLNHNLLTVTDPKGQTWLRVAYHAATNPAAIEFDTVASLQRGADTTHLWRGTLPPRPENRYAVVRCILRDGVGNVCETFCDSLNRPVIVREFTGRSNVQQPVTDVANRPMGKVRADDPDYYETAFEWNRDSLLTRYIWPDGDEVRCVYERDVDPAANPRKKGDLRVHREVSVAVGDLDGDGQADVTERVWRFEHDPRFGSPNPALRPKGIVPNSTTRGGSLTMNSQTSSTRLGGGGGVGKAQLQDFHFTRVTAADHTIKTKNAEGSFRLLGGGGGGKAQLQDFHFTRVTDPRGNVTTATYDEHGNLTQLRVTDPASGVTQLDCDYDVRGRLTRCVQPADAEGRRRQDTFTYYTNGPMAGYLATAVCDVGGLNLTTSFEYDARGNLTRCVNPRGHDSLWTYNALDQVVQAQTPPAGGGQRITAQFLYDANDNLLQVSRENRDANGVLDPGNPWWTSFAVYDALDRPVLVCHEISHSLAHGTVFLTNRLGWDANDNLIRLEGPRAVSGEDPNNWIVCTYDERDLPHMLVAAPGTGLDATNRWDYDAKGNTHRVSKIDAFTIKQKVTENRFRQPVRVTDAAGNVTLFSYDRAGNLTRVRHFGEAHDVPGSVGNRRLLETRFEYDALNRCVRQRGSFFDIFTGQPIEDGESTRTFVYAPNGQLISETDDLGRTTRYTYDTAGRCIAITDPATNRVEFACDATGNITLIRQLDRSDLGGPEQAFLLTRTFDACDRLIRETDNVGNTTQFAYDSRDNVVRVTDPRGNDVCYEYDGLGRLLAERHYAGVCGGTLMTSAAYDYRDTRLVGFTDGNSNVTRYAYDALDRCVAVTNADFTVLQIAYDAFGNCAWQRDANGTVVTNEFDELDRLIRRTIVPGPGVAPDITFEQFAWDGSGRLVLASNNVSRCTFTWDSLGNCRTATQDGFTLSQTCDSLGNPLSLTLPSGRVLSSSYDALNQPTAFSFSGGGAPITLATFAYEGPGRLGRVTRPNGIHTRIHWNGTLNPPNQPGDFGWQQVARVNHARAQGGAVIDQRGYAYDRSQNKIVRAQLVPFVQGGPLLTNRWETDAIDRLVQSVRQTGATDSFRQYQLDANGNRQVVIEDGLAQPYTMDATLPEPADFQMNQYTLTPFGALQYDANGNRIRATTPQGEVFYYYDYADRLVAVQRMEGGMLTPVLSFTYDALGRCVTRTTYPPPPQAPQTVRFIRHPADDSVVEEWRDGALHATHTHHIGGASSASYARLRLADSPRPTAFINSLRLAGNQGRAIIPAGGTPLYVLCDDLGNALALTDAAGNVLERYDYDDFGQPRFLDPAGNPLLSPDGLPVNDSPAGLRWLYRGMYWEPEVGAYRMSDSYLFNGGKALYEWIDTGFHGLSNPLYERPREVGSNPLYEPKTARTLNGGMPHRISMNVSVVRQTQGVDFGRRLYGPGTSHWGSAKVVEKATSGLKDTLKTQVRMADGRHTPFRNKYRPQFYFRAQPGSGTLPATPAQEHRKLLDRGEAGDNVGLLLRAVKSGHEGGINLNVGARHIPLWKRILNYVWDWDPVWEPNDHPHNYAGVDR